MDTLKIGDRVYIVNAFNQFQTGTIQAVDINKQGIWYDILTDGKPKFNFPEDDDLDITIIRDEFRDGNYYPCTIPACIITIYTDNTKHLAIDKIQSDIDHNQMLIDNYNVSLNKLKNTKL